MRAITGYTKSSSFVVSIFFISLLMIGVIFNTYTLTVANDDLVISETQAALQADIGGFRSLYGNAGRSAVIKAIEERSKNPTNDFFYHLENKQNERLAGNLASWGKDNVSSVKNGMIEIQLSFSSDYLATHKHQTESAMAMVLGFDNGDSLLVARSVQDIELAVSLAKISSWVLIVVVFIVAVTSLAVAYYVVSRINKIADKATDIIHTGDLSDRLYVDSQWDDLSKLTLVLNQLLDKIESSVKAISLVSDNIAHDLRTPLTRLKSHIQQLEHDQSRRQLTDECDNILSIFNSLLRISDIENATKISGFSDVNIERILRDAIDLYQPLIEAKDIQLQLDITSVPDVNGDKDLLFQAFANLLDNAIKFTPENGQIYAKLDAEDKQIVFSLEDSGNGVSSENIEKLTRRFFREESSRTSSGNGLGLSLVSAICKLHQAELTFEQSLNSDNSGLRCTIRFSS